MGTFVQVIEYNSARIDEIRTLGEKVAADRGGQPGGPQRILVTEDRDNPGHYLTIVEFDSYEAAMANSEDPATQAFAAQMAELVEGPPTFRNLNVLDVH
jgi:quinol monooxygenase YgiN